MAFQTTGLLPIFGFKRKHNQSNFSEGLVISAAWIAVMELPRVPT
jgi:hypothetical protein